MGKAGIDWSDIKRYALQQYKRNSKIYSIFNHFSITSQLKFTRYCCSARPRLIIPRKVVPTGTVIVYLFIFIYLFISLFKLFTLGSICSTKTSGAEQTTKILFWNDWMISVFVRCNIDGREESESVPLKMSVPLQNSRPPLCELL